MMSEVRTYKLVCDGCNNVKLICDDGGLRDREFIIREHAKEWHRITVYEDYFGWLSKHKDFCPNCDEAYKQACQERQEFIERKSNPYGI